MQLISFGCPSKHLQNYTRLVWIPSRICYTFWI